MKPEWIEDVGFVPELVSLFIRCAEPVYICQGELLEGRADTISTWSQELPTLLADFFTQSIGSGTAVKGGRRSGILAIRNNDAVQGFAVMEIRRFPHKRPHAFLHDIVVDPQARGSGIGTAIMEKLKDELLGEGIDRLFLESGNANYRAHTFFERQGFERISISMMADLGKASRS